MNGRSCGHGRGSKEHGHGREHHHSGRCSCGCHSGRCSCGCHSGRCSCGCHSGGDSHHRSHSGNWRKFTSKREKREMLEGYMSELEEELQAVKEKLEHLS